MGPDRDGRGVHVYVGSASWEDDRDAPGPRLGTVDLSLADKLAQIPIFRRYDKGHRDWRGDLYARLYERSEAVES